jgi:ferric-dicitrate binding protein FerR (iron transport regulator)
VNSSTLKKLIRKYYNNKASAAERYIIDRWYQSFDLDKDNLSWLEDRNRLSEIQNRIIENVIRPQKTISWYNSPLTKIAASILIISSVVVAFYSNQSSRQRAVQVTAVKTISTGIGELKRILLTDSTEVTLNANSTLTVLPGYGKKQRMLKLVGEAYFSVHKDSIRPFIVHTSDLDVKVLGTSFNVQAYGNLKNIKVSVNTGKVQVSDKTKSITFLLPGQQMVYNKHTHGVEKSAIDAETSRQWITGKVVLKGAGFDELARNFFNIYGKEIRSDNPAVLKNEYNLTLRSDRNYEDVLEQLCIMINKKYRKEGKDGIVIY